jgi:uncharacterized protein (UPF0332 family)
VTPEIRELLDKARDCLSRARIILAAGVGEDAGRDAYLAAFHAAQAIIRVRTGRISKTHRGVHRLMANFGRSDPQLADLARFLSRSYNLKSVAGYELGPGADVPLDRASEAVERAAQFIEQIAGWLA